MTLDAVCSMTFTRPKGGSMTVRKLFLLVALVGLALVALPGRAHATGSNNDHKVWVCKYVGTPGDFETLKAGKQPIQVDSPPGHPYQVGDDFVDGQFHSYVIDVVTVENTDSHNDYTGSAQCPSPPSTTTTTESPSTSTTTAVSTSSSSTTTAAPNTTTSTVPPVTTTSSPQCDDCQTSTTSVASTSTSTVPSTVTIETTVPDCSAGCVVPECPDCPTFPPSSQIGTPQHFSAVAPQQPLPFTGSDGTLPYAGIALIAVGAAGAAVAGRKR